MNRHQRRAQKKIRLKDIKQGPLRHRTLPSTLLLRIRALHAQLKGYDGCGSLANWMEGFQRDMHPEREVAIWESIARTLTTFLEGRDLGKAHRQEAYMAVLSYSMHAVSGPSFKLLSAQESEELMAIAHAELGD